VLLTRCLILGLSKSSHQALRQMSPRQCRKSRRSYQRSRGLKQQVQVPDTTTQVQLSLQLSLKYLTNPTLSRTLAIVLQVSLPMQSSTRPRDNHLPQPRRPQSEEWVLRKPSNFNIQNDIKSLFGHKILRLFLPNPRPHNSSLSRRL
jgi:hypothetical protein